MAGRLWQGHSIQCSNQGVPFVESYSSAMLAELGPEFTASVIKASKDTPSPCTFFEVCQCVLHHADGICDAIECSESALCLLVMHDKMDKLDFERWNV
jgi:hypothetical protein